MSRDEGERLFFETPEEFREWLEAHHDSVEVQWIGFKKVDTGLPSLTWNESVDEALCFGWIDGLRRRVDDESYEIRFTPRRPTSTWSAKNVARMKELIEEGRVRRAGMAAWEARAEERSGTYSYEQRDAARLDPGFERRFRAEREAWKYFHGEAPSYRATATYWVMSAKKQETRERRLGVLIESSAEGLRIPPLRR